MNEKHIGIIIQNQDEKILLCDDTYYIKVEIHEDDNINKVIASKIKETVDMNIFKIIETYVYTPDSKLVDLNILSDEEFIMYLVEVYIYHNEFNFVKKEDLLEIISNHSEREFFKENFIDHILYEISSRSFIFNNILIIFNLLIYLSFSISLSKTTFWSILFLIFCSYFIVSKYAVPKFVNFLVKSKISTNTINKLDFLSCFILIFILVKIYIL